MDSSASTTTGEGASVPGTPPPDDFPLTPYTVAYLDSLYERIERYFVEHSTDSFTGEIGYLMTAQADLRRFRYLVRDIVKRHRPDFPAIGRRVADRDRAVLDALGAEDHEEPKAPGDPPAPVVSLHCTFVAPTHDQPAESWEIAFSTVNESGATVPLAGVSLTTAGEFPNRSFVVEAYDRYGGLPEPLVIASYPTLRAVAGATILRHALEGTSSFPIDWRRMLTRACVVVARNHFPNDPILAHADGVG